MAAGDPAFTLPDPKAFEAPDSRAGRDFAGHKMVKIPKTGEVPFRYAARSQSLSRQAFLKHSPVKVGQRTIMLVPEIPSRLRAVPAAKDFDAVSQDGWREPVNICAVEFARGVWVRRNPRALPEFRCCAISP